VGQPGRPTLVPQRPIAPTNCPQVANGHPSKSRQITAASIIPLGSIPHRTRGRPIAAACMIGR